MRRFILPGAAIALLFVLTACQRPPAETVSAFKPAVSFQDLMVAVVDPNADRLWDSVSTEVTKAGIVEKQPRTDEEWAALREQAVTLVEAANLLAVEGRPLAAPRKVLDNKNGYLDPEEIRKAIESDRPAFLQRVAEFRDAGARALAAVDARKPAAVVDAGARIQQACEHCHLRYWYPNGGPPSAAEFSTRRTAAVAR